MVDLATPMDEEVTWLNVVWIDNFDKIEPLTRAVYPILAKRQNSEPNSSFVIFQDDLHGVNLQCFLDLS